LIRRFHCLQWAAARWGVSSVLGGTVAAIPTVDPHSLNASVNRGVTGSNGIGTTGNINIFADPAKAFASFRDINLSTDTRDGGGNPLRALGQWNYDMAVHKTTTIHESVTFDFRRNFSTSSTTSTSSRQVCRLRRIL